MAVPTAYMGLSLPTPSATLGPEWATDLNAAFALVDSHDHTPSHGVLVPSAGLNINADLPFNSNNASLLRSTRYVDNTAPLALPTDANAIYVSGGNLYFNSGAGLQVQITSGGALSASSLGEITGLPGTTATAAYSPSTQTFTWLQAPGTSALMDMGPLTIHDTAAGGPPGITLKSPAAIPNPYTITLPSALPASTKLLSIGSTGATTYADVDNSTLQNVSGILSVKDQGITAAKIANGAITAAQIAVPVPTAVTPNANWTAFAGLAYWKDASGTVHFKGAATFTVGGGTTIFTLPAGFRPGLIRVFPGLDETSASTTTPVTIGVNTSGAVTVSGTTLTDGHVYGLEGITFLAEG